MLIALEENHCLCNAAQGETNSFQFPVVILLCQIPNIWLTFDKYFFPHVFPDSSMHCGPKSPMYLSTWAIHTGATQVPNVMHVWGLHCIHSWAAFKSGYKDVNGNPPYSSLMPPYDKCHTNVIQWKNTLCSWCVLLCDEPRSDKT